MSHRLIFADVLDGLRQLDDESVQCIVTSPPYWNLRNYGVDGQIGLEPTISEYVEKMRDVFRECKRVLRNDGVCFLNLGDSYASNWACNRRNAIGNGALENGKREARPPRISDNLKEKDLCGIPWRVAFALQDDGWYLRSDIIWSKPNPMPESITDRPTSAHEHIFLLSKAQRYFYDMDAIREKAVVAFDPDYVSPKKDWRDIGWDTDEQGRAVKTGNPIQNTAPQAPENGRNARNVWTITTEGYRGAHYAVFPSEIPRRCISAGSRAGDTVLDPFAGSGTTIQVAIELGRNVIGIDLDERNRALIEKRILGTTPPLEGIA